MPTAGSALHPAGTQRPAVQVFARDTHAPPEAPLVRLQRGQADLLRPLTRSGQLICPIDGCADPRLTTRGGSRRDHFAHRHRSGPEHGAETIAHHTAKHLLAAWLRQQHPNAKVYPDTRDVEDGQRPDVLLELNPTAGNNAGISTADDSTVSRNIEERGNPQSDGSAPPRYDRIAYEVQFAGLTVAQWRERHQRYAALGIRDVWLFGGRRYHRPTRSALASERARQQAPAPDDEPGVSAKGSAQPAGLNSRTGLAGEAPEDTIDHHPAVPSILRERAWVPVFTAVLASGHPLLLIEPEVEQVALGAGYAVETVLAWHAEDAVDGYDFTAHWYPLDHARCPGGVLELPFMRAQGQQARLRHEREHEQRRHERAHRAAREQERARREARYDNLVHAWQHERELLQWQHGVFPAVLEQEPHADEVHLQRAPQQWRWLIAAALTPYVGQRIDPRGLVTFTHPEKGLPASVPERLVSRFLLALRAEGCVWFSGKRGPRTEEAVLVLRDPLAPTENVPAGDAPAVSPATQDWWQYAYLHRTDALRLMSGDGRVLWSTPARHPEADWDERLNAREGVQRGRLLLKHLRLPAPTDPLAR